MLITYLQLNCSREVEKASSTFVQTFYVSVHNERKAANQEVNHLL